MPPIEDFSTISPSSNDQSSAVLRELNVLSERPLPPPLVPVQIDQSASESAIAAQQRAMRDSNATQLPPVSVHDGGTRENSGAQENKLDTLPNQLLNLGLAAAAICGAEAIGAVVFRNPKLAGMALETATGSAKVGLASAELAAGTSSLDLAANLTKASSKFGFLTGDSAQLYGKISIFAGTYGTSIAARHYSYAALTGQEESWMDSFNQVGTGAIGIMLGRQLWKWSDKL